MPFCKNCGSAVEGQFCSKCGTPVAAQEVPEYNPPPPAQPYAEPAGGTAPSAPAPAVAGGLTDNVAALLCYVFGLVTGILFLVIEPYNRNRLVRFHAFQSIFFNIAVVAAFIGLSIVAVALHVIPGVWVLMALLHLAVWLGSVVVWVLLLVKAYQGQQWKLPIIGGLAEKQAQA
jgi:uncharacterized membrane protein